MRQYIKEIGAHSSIYAVSNILTKAIGVLLIPIYTRFLTTEDYGIISIITPLINAVAIFYSFGLRQAYGRFHFDQEDKSKEQKQLLGTVLLFIITIGLTGNIIIILLGESFFENVFPEIDFYPFVF
ncbi:MAG: oligosaccharide flippase family protein [Bacteroidales bacterium]|nr:oligosaccharide flippase family protein [Bacteroidales bacterium]